MRNKRIDSEEEHERWQKQGEMMFERVRRLFVDIMNPNPTPSLYRKLIRHFFHKLAAVPPPQEGSSPALASYTFRLLQRNRNG